MIPADQLSLTVVMHLTAPRALREAHGGFPCGVKLICEGSEEQGTGGLGAFVAENADLLRADTALQRACRDVPGGGDLLMGVEEPKCLIHAPNESVDPSEIEHLALAEALFLEKHAVAGR